VTDSRVTPQAAAVDAVDRQLLSWFEGEMSAEHRRVLALEIVERSGAVPLLCQPLQDENDRLRQTIEELTESRGTERLVHRLQEDRLRVDAGRAPRWEDDPIVIEHGWLDGRCAGCGEALPAAVPVGTGSVDQCHNGHPFEPGIDSDMAAEGRTPDPRWCNVCGEGRRPVGTGNPTQPRADD
jgi:hypothetical protein